jgi:hypothetical protein
MLSTLFTETSERIDVGSILNLASESYLIVTKTFHERDRLQSTLENTDFRDLSGFKILSFRPNFFTASRYAGVVKIDRIEIAALLRILEDQLMVRFEGEYTTKELPLNRFQNTGEKILIRDDTNKLVGIYHDSTGTFLISPDEVDSTDSGVPQLEESIFRSGTIKSPASYTENESPEGIKNSPNEIEPFRSIMNTAKRYLLIDSRR